MVAKIGENTLKSASLLLTKLLAAHMKEIQEAWTKSDGPLSINMSLKISPDDRDEQTVSIDAGISFTLEKIKDSITARYNEIQGELFS